MNIAFGVEHFDPARGGAERYVWDFAQWLVARGHALTIYASGLPRALPGATVIGLDLLRYPGSPQYRFARAFQDALKNGAYDLVQGFNHVWPGDVLMLHGGVHLAFEHFNALSAPTSLGRHMKKLGYRLFTKYRALRDNERMQFDDPRTHYVAVSQRVADDMVRYYPSVRDRIHVIMPGLAGERYAAPALAGVGRGLRGQWGVPEETVVFLFVSNNFRLKGLHDLIRALPALREPMKGAFELWVAGRGHASAYKRLAARLGVGKQVRFVGSVEDIRTVYGAADVLVHPSYYDTFGGVCLEAMACGLPVVVSKNAGASEIVQDGVGGVLFEMPAAPQIIAQAMLMAAQESFRRQARRINPTLAAQHPMSAHFERMERLYSTLSRNR